MKKLVSIVLCMVFCLSLGLSSLGVSAQSATPKKLYPDDLLASAENFGEYFTSASKCTSETVAGETIFSVPNVVPCSREAVPYDAYTIHMEVALVLYRLETAGINHGEEVCLIFGMGSNKTAPFHQVQFLNSNGYLKINHQYHNGSKWVTYAEDATLLDFAIDDQDLYFTVTVQIDATNVYVYIEDEFVVQLTDAEGCVDDLGFIGMRTSGEGFKMKNFNVYEGILEPEDIGKESATTAPTEQPTVTPTEEPTEDPTKAPEADNTQAPETGAVPDATPEQGIDNQNQDGGIGAWVWIVVAIVAVVIVGCVIVVILVMKKKK